MRRTSRGALGRVMGSPRRHDSIHGTDQVRGTPPPTRRAKSRNGRGSRPGASATIARPRTSTFGTKPAAHWVAAACAACSPLIDERATSTTRVGVGEAACGHMWLAEGQLGTSCDRLDSPDPPCTPSQHNVASGARSTTGICTAGVGMPRCGAVGPGGCSTGPTAAGVAVGSGLAGRDTHGFTPSVKTTPWIMVLRSFSSLS